MPLILTQSNSVFLHTPKTGGTWVREALTNGGVPWIDVGNQHADYKQARESTKYGEPTKILPCKPTAIPEELKTLARECLDRHPTDLDEANKCWMEEVVELPRFNKWQLELVEQVSRHIIAESNYTKNIEIIRQAKVGLRFTIIRHPFSWYQSYWAMKNREGWQSAIVSSTCFSHTFEGFIVSMCKYHKAYLNRLYSKYAARGVYVLRTETLTTDLLRLLSLLGEKHSPEEIIQTPKVNCRSNTVDVDYSEKTIKLLGKSEYSVLHKYDYSIKDYQYA